MCTVYTIGPVDFCDYIDECNEIQWGCKAAGAISIKYIGFIFFYDAATDIYIYSEKDREKVKTHDHT